MNNLIKTDQYLFLLDLNPDTKIVEGDLCYFNCGYATGIHTYKGEKNIEFWTKILAHLPLNNSKPLDFSLLPELESKEDNISLDLANDAFDKTSFPSVERNCFFEGAKFGYKANQKRYTEKNIIKAIHFGQMSVKESSQKLFEKKGLVLAEVTKQFIQSLTTTKYPVSFEITLERETLYTEDGLDYKGKEQPKIVDNVLQGRYVY